MSSKFDHKKVMPRLQRHRYHHDDFRHSRSG